MDIANGRKIELLAPAGSFQSLQAVIEAGCDAVYIGGSRFGARAYADNPEEDELLEAIDYAHLHGVPVYLTVNTLLKDRELSELVEYLRPYYERGLDAVIVQDYGVMQTVAEQFPDMPIHISTQMTITNGEAEVLFPKTVTRIVPARELSLADIRELRRQTDKELEIFVHGALCYSYSGQCLMSSMIGGRSGNRGRCAQPCRKEYTLSTGVESNKTGYFLSPKDQCLLPRLHELLDTGIHSLKIEGRMKRPEYASGVTAVYRKWLDRYERLGSSAYADYVAKHTAEMQKDIQRLAELYNRGGFCQGYTFDRKGPEMMAMERPNHTGVAVGKARVRRNRTGSGEMRYVAALSFSQEVGAGDVLELRDKEERIYREFTIGKEGDRKRYAEMPIVVKKEWREVPTELTVYRTRKESLLAELQEQYVTGREPSPIQGVFRAEVGSPMELCISSPEGTTRVSVSGDVVEAAGKAPATAEQVEKQLRKTGDSGYAFSELEIALGEECFLPVSRLNDLRRRALTEYREAVLRSYARTYDVVGQAGESNEQWTTVGNAMLVRNVDESIESGGEPAEVRKEASKLPETLVGVQTMEQWQAVCSEGMETTVLLDMEGQYKECMREADCFGIWLALPRISKEATRRQVQSELPELLQSGKLGGILVRTLDQLVYVRDLQNRLGTELPIVSDTTLSVMNRQAGEWLRKQGVAAVTLSQELRREELQAFAGEGYVTVYGRSVLMVSEQCVRKNTQGCTGREERNMLWDSAGAGFPVRNVCKYCYNLLYNAHITSLLPYAQQVTEVGALGHRLDFTKESAAEVRDVLRAYRQAFSSAGETTPRMGEGFTGGHWKRGVQ